MFIFQLNVDEIKTLDEICELFDEAPSNGFFYALWNFSTLVRIGVDIPASIRLFYEEVLRKNLPKGFDFWLAPKDGRVFFVYDAKNTGRSVVSLDLKKDFPSIYTEFESIRDKVAIG